MLRLETAHACVIAELAPAVLGLVVASFAQIVMPAHRFSVRSSEFQAFQLFGDLCWLSFSNLLSAS